jgi:tetratricopeptide (TPR) repeat protein
MKRAASVTVLLLPFLAGCASKGVHEGHSGPAPTAAAGRQAPLFDDLGDHRHAISTKSPEAQRYFDQGLMLAWGFNHAEAGRSFREAARLDPGCAMCWWGASLVLGPNINAPMEDGAVPDAWEALQKAMALAPNVSEPERAYIAALSKRYVAKPLKDRKPLDRAYADAMREVAQKYPDDLDAAALFAEALMDVTPWDYWEKDGRPKAWTPEILSTLESILARDPDHVAGIHFYIHATEASTAPERAEKYADKLGALVPGAGHLVHMPAHTYMRVGRYHDASLANELASKADESYITQCRAQGIYPLVYHPHNVHFLVASAAMEGRAAVSIAAARKLATHSDPKMMREPGLETLQHYWITPLYALTRFSKWDEILEEPRPANGLDYPTGVWHYARGMALSATGQADPARKELAALSAIAGKPAMKSQTIWGFNSFASILGLAVQFLEADIASRGGDAAKAVAHLTKAVALEDDLIYQEPPDWYASARQALGATLGRAGRWADAEAAYRADLVRNPENGWSLAGLAAALDAQGKGAEAGEARKRLEKAWALADVSIAAR